VTCSDCGVRLTGENWWPTLTFGDLCDDCFRHRAHMENLRYRQEPS
jgi:hypothetical protein